MMFCEDLRKRTFLVVDGVDQEFKIIIEARLATGEVIVPLPDKKNPEPEPEEEQ
ncbi:hypothetical protein ACFL01_04170 [Planctomycetota bacterium]